MHNDKRSMKIWLVPIVAILLTIAVGAFFRLVVGTEDAQHFDYKTTPFVPASSPYATGTDSR